MDKNKLANKWNEWKHHAREQWNKLSNEDIDMIHGNADKLSEQLQKKYGWSKDQADREINRFCQTCESKMGKNREEQEWREEGIESEEKMEGREKMYGEEKMGGREKMHGEEKMGGREKMRSPELHRGSHKPEDKIQKYGEDQEKKRKTG